MPVQAAHCLHEWFARQVAASPAAPAVWHANGTLVYAELNARAERLAQRLRALGVGRGARVGVALERSPELVIGLIAVLKAGAAYVPLDPGHPPERIAFMMADARPAVLLADAAFAARHAGRVPHLLNPAEDAPLDAPPATQAARAETEDLAYVIYTSGSTGAPKGVMVPHRAVCNHLRWRHEYFGLDAGDRVLHKSSISFDDSVWEIFEPLTAGACLVLAPPGAERDPEQLVRVMREQRVSAACFVPWLLDALLRVPELAACTHLRRVTTGGETLTPALLERYTRTLSAPLYNGYGPTETTIACTFWRCVPRADGRVPVGRPISDTQVHIFDEKLQPVPPGEIGEICIGGAGVAHGYWNRAELTAERFVPDPYSGSPQAQIYRSGDLGRWLPDGELEFRGRVDRQVKLRGMRIELGEIEAALLAHPEVREAAVSVYEPQGEERRLVAYVVAEREPPPGAKSLRTHLARQLPAAMIPAQFLQLAALPRLPNQKIDYGALPAPRFPHDEGAEAPPEVQPHSSMEQALAAIWAELLGRERIGVHEDFFAIGGHSLLATQLVARIRKRLQVGITVRQIFEAPTVAGLAALLSQQGASLQAEPALQPTPRSTRGIPSRNSSPRSDSE